MGFKIFANGKITKNEDIHYSKENCPDDDSFDLADIASALHGLAGDPKGALEAQIPSGVSDGYLGLLKIESVHNLVNAVDFLILESVATNGYIYLSCLNKNLVFDDAAQKTFYFTGSNSGADFMRAIYPSLEETDMNNYGVILQMWKFISKVARKIGPNVRPIITIDLTRS